jgi:hypothetical protein
MRRGGVALAVLWVALGVPVACAREPMDDGAAGVAPESAPTAAPAESPAGRDWTVGPRGAGPVRIGMTRDELRASLGVEPAALGPAGECAYVVPAGAPAGLAVMIVDGRVVRIDVDRDSVARTAIGVRPGLPEARARELLGPQTEVTPHKYVDGGRYLTAPSGEGDTWWVVSTDGNAVTDLQVGVMPQVRWVEGCS